MSTVNNYKFRRNSYRFPLSRDIDESLPETDRKLHTSPNVNLATE